MPSWKLSKEIGLLRDPQLLPISVVSLVDESHGLYDIMQPHQTHQALRLKLRRIFPRGSSRDTHSIWSSGKRERIYIATMAASPAAGSTWQQAAVSQRERQVKRDGWWREPFCLPSLWHEFPKSDPKGELQPA